MHGTDAYFSFTPCDPHRFGKTFPFITIIDHKIAFYIKVLMVDPEVRFVSLRHRAAEQPYH